MKQRLGNFDMYDITNQTITEDKELLQDTVNKMIDWLITRLNEKPSIKIPDTYVAETLNVFRDNFNYILNLWKNEQTRIEENILISEDWKEYYSLKD